MQDDKEISVKMLWHVWPGRLRASKAILFLVISLAIVGTAGGVAHGTNEAEQSAESATALSGAVAEAETVDRADEPADDDIDAPTAHHDEGTSDEEPGRQKRIIGATAQVQERQSGYLFEARVDTGAKTCRLQVDRLVIQDEAEEMSENIGKTAKFAVHNGKLETWCQAKIEDTVKLKTTDGFVRHYQVRLELRWKDIQKKVFVTLIEGDDTKFPLLIGRNFLRRDFLVDVDIGNTDQAPE